MRIERTETATGGPQRTRREEIVPVFKEGTFVEPDLRGDASGSMGWEIAPPEGSEPKRWPVMLEAMHGLVGAAEALDSQAAAEQAGGSDEKGGLYAAFFNHGLVTVGEGDDGGDLNTANFQRKIDAMQRTYGVPDGGTCIMPANRYLDQHYLDEFEKDEKTGMVVPVAQRPVRACVVFTDGELTDADQFGRRLLENHSDLWPREEWFIAILGYGPEHDKTLAQYQKIAAKHPNVRVYSFDRVSNPAEIAEDMAIAVLPQS